MVPLWESTSSPAGDRQCPYLFGWPGPWRHELAFAFADPMDVTTLGLRLRNIPALPQGRAVDASTGLIVQAATNWSGVAAPEADALPRPVEVMPDTVERGDMGSASLTEGCWRIPVGIGEHDLAPVDLVLDLSDHGLVGGGPTDGEEHHVGDPGRGCSGGAGCHRHRIRPPTQPAARQRGAPASSPTQPTCPLSSTRYSPPRGRTSFWWTMPDTTDDPGGCLARLVAARHEQVHVVAAGRSDELRRAYNHWTGAVRKSKVGVLLDPDVTDAELLGAKLPPLAAGSRPPGRGYLVESGSAQLVQIAR